MKANSKLLLFEKYDYVIIINDMQQPTTKDTTPTQFPTFKHWRKVLERLSNSPKVVPLTGWLMIFYGFYVFVYLFTVLLPLILKEIRGTSEILIIAIPLSIGFFVVFSLGFILLWRASSQLLHHNAAGVHSAMVACIYNLLPGLYSVASLDNILPRGSWLVALFVYLIFNLIMLILLAWTKNNFRTKANA